MDVRDVCLTAGCTPRESLSQVRATRYGRAKAEQEGSWVQFYRGIGDGGSGTGGLVAAASCQSALFSY